VKPLPSKPRIGISACLLGQEVRYDGGHKRDAFLTEVLGRYVAWVPVCPEVELGMGTPRPPIRLERRSGEIRLVMPSTGDDYTEAMRTFTERRVDELAKLDLGGYILKKDSPSCGVEGVKVYDGPGSPSLTGRGLFAAALIARLPDLPVEEEGRLRDPLLRESFVARVFARHHLRLLEVAAWRTDATSSLPARRY
jgi:uncharacterized protein YbbK (DUF523 family)